jgi:hypothetical protein
MLFALASGCAAQGPSNNKAASARLTWATPVARLELGPAPAGSSIIAVTVGSVHNPEREPVTVQLSLDGTPPVPISVISLFPSDQPGRFIVRVPSTAARARPILIATLIESAPQPRSPRLALDDLKAEWVEEPK